MYLVFAPRNVFRTFPVNLTSHKSANDYHAGGHQVGTNFKRVMHTKTKYIHQKKVLFVSAKAIKVLKV